MPRNKGSSASPRRSNTLPEQHSSVGSCRSWGGRPKAADYANEDEDEGDDHDDDDDDDEEEEEDGDEGGDEDDDDD